MYNKLKILREIKDHISDHGEIESTVVPKLRKLEHCLEKRKPSTVPQPHLKSLAPEEGITFRFSAEEILEHIGGVDGASWLQNATPVVASDFGIHHPLHFESVWPDTNVKYSIVG